MFLRAEVTMRTGLFLILIGLIGCAKDAKDREHLTEQEILKHEEEGFGVHGAVFLCSFAPKEGAQGTP